MREVSSNFQRRNGRIEGRTSKLERPTHHSDPTILALLGALAEVGEDGLEPTQELLRACRHRYQSELLSYTTYYSHYTTAMDDSLDHRAKALHLITENQFLRSELEEYHFRERNLRKELEIMAQVREEQSRPPQREQHMLEQLQNQKARVNLLSAEKQQLQASNRLLQEKVNDLKYNNAELKNLNERTTHLHLKEIEMMRKEAQQEGVPLWQERERRLMKEKEGLEKKLQSCAEIANEMENYYTNEIKKLRETVRLREEDLRTVNREVEGTRTQRTSQGETLKQCNEQWEKACGVMREDYEQEIKELRNKVKFLINKLQSMQEGDRQGMGQMVQSKMVQSSASIDSCRFTPSSSVSSKEPSTRRNTSGMKPAQPMGRMGKSHPLGERNL